MEITAKLVTAYLFLKAANNHRQMKRTPLPILNSPSSDIDKLQKSEISCESISLLL